MNKFTESSIPLYDGVPEVIYQLPTMPAYGLSHEQHGLSKPEIQTLPSSSELVATQPSFPIQATKLARRSRESLRTETVILDQIHEENATQLAELFESSAADRIAAVRRVQAQRAKLDALTSRIAELDHFAAPFYRSVGRLFLPDVLRTTPAS